MPDPPANDLSSAFLSHMLKNQRSIRNYIFSLHPRVQDLDDLVQQTALTLWREFDGSIATREFLPWALRVSYFEVLRLRKKQSRDRLVFPEDLVEMLASETTEEDDIPDSRRQALEACLAKLDQRSHEVIMARYAKGATVQDLAAKHRVNAHRLYRILDNARAALVACVRREMHSAGGAQPS